MCCTQNLKSFMVVLIPTGTITVRVIAVMAAEAWHLRTDVWGNCSLIFSMGSRAGCISCSDMLGWVRMITVSNNRRRRIGTCPSCREPKHAPGWDGGCV